MNILQARMLGEMRLVNLSMEAAIAIDRMDALQPLTESQVRKRDRLLQRLQVVDFVLDELDEKYEMGIVQRSEN